MFDTRRKREESEEPIHALVLTFNRTLAGYVRNLAEHQVSNDIDVRLEIETFSRWAMSYLGYPDVEEGKTRRKLRSLATSVEGLTVDYVVSEVEYLLGRFNPEDLDDYMSVERTGRGTMPRVGRPLRQAILSNIVDPYIAWTRSNEFLDWNSLAIRMQKIKSIGYDIVIVDESQDFSANQLRAIRHHLNEDHAVTFVIDTAQRIYARGFTWTEAGYSVRPERSHTLHQNHRNTREIAAFAAGVLKGMKIEADGALPNLNNAQATGPLPLVLRGLYRNQAQAAVDYIKEKVNLGEDSIAFLKPMGGNWFDEIARRLSLEGIEYVNITKESEWPTGSENVALSTFHSAKGLEFDYVFILGLSDETTQFSNEGSEDRVYVLRRLLAVAIARARKAVIVGYKPGEESRLVQFFESSTYVVQDV